MHNHPFCAWAFSTFTLMGCGLFLTPHLRAQQQTSITVEHIAPEKLKEHKFKTDEFTFVRIHYKGNGDKETTGRWDTDYPDADINFSNRLREQTQLTVATNPLTLELLDLDLLKHSFAYVSANGGFFLVDQDVNALQNYLNKGGFVLIDDSWGDKEYKGIVEQLKKVFPDKTLQELPIEHDIFHCVYDFKEKPQVLSIHDAWRQNGPPIQVDYVKASYQAITDNNGRVVLLLAHNTDLADGWERINEDADYAREYSNKLAFPMGINIVTYALLTAK